MVDITTMLSNFSTSIEPIEMFITGFAYLGGVAFIFAGITKLKELVNKHAQTPTQWPYIVPFAYILGGAAMIYVPTTLDVATETFFGADSLLSYSSWSTEMLDKYANSTYVVTLMTEMAGLIWFVRGCYLMIISSKPGTQFGGKGLAFVIAGIFAMNFMYTSEIIANTAQKIFSSQHYLYPIIFSVTGN